MPFAAVCRNYSCARGDPSVADIVAGNALGPGACACDDAAYCARVASGSFPVRAQVDVPAALLGACSGICACGLQI